MPLSLNSLTFTDVPPSTVRAIAARHGLGVDTYMPLPQVGMINSIYALGDSFVLRVPRNHAGTIAQAHTEVVAAPAAVAASVRTPRLVAYDDTRDLLPVPYMIFERVQGRTLGLLEWEPTEFPHIWRELGRDLAFLHTGVPADGPGWNGMHGCSPRSGRPMDGSPALKSGGSRAGWIGLPL